MGFEHLGREARVTRSERTPLGLEVEVNDNGKIFTIRAADPEDKLTIVRGLQGVPRIDELSPETLRKIRVALQDLTEFA